MLLYLGDKPEKTQECVSDTVENGNQLHQSNHTTTTQQQTISPSSSEESISNVSTTTDISTVDPVTIRASEPELTCTIVQKQKQGKPSWIIIDGQKRRYSQQKKNVSDIFQCTANVSEQNKKCKGTINVENLEGKLEEWKTDREKTFTFTVRNAHEKHLPRKRSSRSTVTETSSPSNKKRKT
jgi:riboflavin biosynthesis pyrimidine reductase